jgi:hypothetical protein
LSKVSKVKRSGNTGSGIGVHSDGNLGDIHSINLQVGTPVARSDLHDAEAEASLQLPSSAVRRGIEPLTNLLSPTLTVASPAWFGDPIPLMRGLEKKMVEYSLTLPQDERKHIMAAISVVEIAVHLRLRYQQMRMSDLEMQVKVDNK